MALICDIIFWHFLCHSILGFVVAFNQGTILTCHQVSSLAFILKLSLAYYFAFLLTFYLAFVLALYLAFCSGSVFGVHFDILFGHSIWHLFWNSALPSSGFHSGFYRRRLSGIPSGILFDIYFDMLVQRAQPITKLFHVQFCHAQFFQTICVPPFPFSVLPFHAFSHPVFTPVMCLTE